MKNTLISIFKKRYPLFTIKKTLFYSVNKKKFYLSKVPCEVCNSKDNFIFQNLGKDNFDNNKYKYLPISICKNCGHKFLSPRPSNNFYKSYFNYDYGKTFHGKKKEFANNKLSLQKKRGEKVFNYFKKILKLKNGKILDHGCSTGITSLMWKKNHWDVYGVDPHKPSVVFGNRKFNLKISLGYGEKLHFKKNFFDVVLSLGSLEHCYNLNKSLSEIKIILKPSGYLIIRWRKFELKGSPIEYYNSSTLRYFNKYTWYRSLEKNGLKIEKVINHPIEGYETFEYLLVKKISKNKIVKVNQIHKYSFQNQLKYYLKYENQYRKSCIDIRSKKLLNSRTRFKKKINYIKKNNISLMNLGKFKSVNRYFEEIRKYIDYFSL